MKLNLAKKHWSWWLMIIPAILLPVVLYAWYRINLLPVSNSQTPVSFEVKAGDKPAAIGENLEQSGIIRSKDAFGVFVTVHGLRGKLQTGFYALKPSYSAVAVADILANGRVDSHSLIVPEGTTLAKIRQLATQKGIKPEEFDAALAGNYGKEFLLGRPANVSLEGYLFPDTYQVGTQTGAATALIQAMLDNFDRRVTPELRQAFSDQGLTLHQGLTLASMVEREVANPADRPVVAQIFLNRLKNGQPLESDVTVQYGAELLGQPFSTSLSSPYNTYRISGLPLGPICNPGLVAIQAAAHPAPTNYLYFVAGKDGQTHFARTFAEHQQNVQKYLK